MSLQKNILIISTILVLIAIATNVGSAEVKIDACACHSSFTGKLGAPVKEWLSSGHAKSKIICADCHGGDPTSMNRSVSMNRTYVKPPYKKFIGVPKKETIPELCASCHANETYMKKYDLEPNQYSTYLTSKHGVEALQKNNMDAPVCSDCHGAHKAAIPNPIAIVSADETHGCGRCHPLQSETYMQGPHYKGLVIGLEKYAKNATYNFSRGVPINNITTDMFIGPDCQTCHGSHGIVRTSAHTEFAWPNIRDVTYMKNTRCEKCHGDTAVQEGDRVKPSLEDVWAQFMAFQNTLDKARTRLEEANASIRWAEQVGVPRKYMNKIYEKYKQAENVTNEANGITIHNIEISTDKSIEAVKLSDDTIKLANQTIFQTGIRKAAMIFGIITIIGFGLVLYFRRTM
ncbi:MAG: cytochrome c3 family protein [Methanosarcinales archaeon]